MKIRSITTGVSLNDISETQKIHEANIFNKHAFRLFSNYGYEVQTTRVSTNSWENYIHSKNETEIIEKIKNLENFCLDNEINFVNIGFAEKPEYIKLLAEINKQTSIISSSVKIGDTETGINFQNIKLAAETIQRISKNDNFGFGNFRFCAWANCPAGIPFFPASYHSEKESSFSIGLECSDLAVKAFAKAKSFSEIENCLFEEFSNALIPVEKLASQLANVFNVKFNGIDTSLAPSLNPDESIAFAFEKSGFGKFGNQGTLFLSSIITKVLKNLPVKTCGYAGLMLPVCEDYGLVQRANDDNYSISELLLYSTVCGTGLDTIPIPGNTPVEKIEMILLDMAALSVKLNKPLSARLLLIPNRCAGEMTEFNSPYLINSKIFHVK